MQTDMGNSLVLGERWRGSNVHYLMKRDEGSQMYLVTRRDIEGAILLCLMERDKGSYMCLDS